MEDSPWGRGSKGSFHCISNGSVTWSRHFQGTFFFFGPPHVEEHQSSCDASKEACLGLLEPCWYRPCDNADLSLEQHSRLELSERVKTVWCQADMTSWQRDKQHTHTDATYKRAGEPDVSVRGPRPRAKGCVYTCPLIIYHFVAKPGRRPPIEPPTILCCAQAERAHRRTYADGVRC